MLTQSATTHCMPTCFFLQAGCPPLPAYHLSPPCHPPHPHPSAVPHTLRVRIWLPTWHCPAGCRPAVGAGQRADWLAEVPPAKGRRPGHRRRVSGRAMAHAGAATRREGQVGAPGHARGAREASRGGVVGASKVQSGQVWQTSDVICRRRQGLLTYYINIYILFILYRTVYKLSLCRYINLACAPHVDTPSTAQRLCS